MGNSDVRRTVSRLLLSRCLLATAVLGGPWLATRSAAQQVATAPSAKRESARVTIQVDQAPLTTVLHLIAQQAGLVDGFNDSVIPSSARVTLHLRNVSATDAFEQALRGTGLYAKVLDGGDVAIVRNTSAPADGSITGRITNGTTKQPVRGAKIGLDGNDRVAETADDGTYRIAHVSAGTHTITVKLIGYAKATRSVTVQDGAASTMDVALTLSATALDQVVVTGTVIPTELRAVPNAITVITAKELEQRGITHIDQLFRGDVPGLFAQNRSSDQFLGEVTMFSRGATALPMFGVNAIQNSSLSYTGTTNPIKTYVDGVEMADPKYLSQIDPKSIERIEILTGPQASTIYGSNALNGVMQIFTKRGATTRPQVTLSLLSGFVQNNFNSARAPQHDYSGSISGVDGRISYNAGASWDYMAPWSPAAKRAVLSGYGGAKFSFATPAGPLSADVTFRRSTTQNWSTGSFAQTYIANQQSGAFTPYGSGRYPTYNSLVGQTLGLTLDYAPFSWWSHHVSVGQDASDTEGRNTALGYTANYDTMLYLSQDHSSRHDIAYTTTANLPLSSLAKATITLGADGWQGIQSSVGIRTPSLSGNLIGSPSVSRQPSHNTGAFMQTQFGILENVFLTYGVRAEWNPNFGSDVQPNITPRYGISLVENIGALTAKVRASYGRSTRPPEHGQKVAFKIADLCSACLAYYGPDYGNFDFIMANSELQPEYQRGPEFGTDLYFGNLGSLTITRYDQRVDGLIAQVRGVDSVRSLAPLPADCKQTFRCESRDVNGYGYDMQLQYVNVGSIRNQGWELGGKTNFGPFIANGTYSWTKSRTIGVNPKYRAYFASEYHGDQYAPGATFQFLAEHTWAFGLTYALGGTTVGLNFNGIGQLRNFESAFYDQHLIYSIRLQQNRWNVTAPYVSMNPSYTLADLNAAHRFTSTVEGVLQMQNVGNYYQNDESAYAATLGRQTKVGLRVRF